ncbi:TPA: hypothetical protein DEP96_01905 [Candidatus Uhrbacteria bacterium]|nr:hypothetical protein [Candidatus Uhrbacteria bacterium]
MSLLGIYLKVNNYLCRIFKGRLNRVEYFFSILFILFIGFIAYLLLISSFIFLKIPALVILLISAIHFLSLQARRFQDIGISWNWFYTFFFFIPLINLLTYIFLLFHEADKDNMFGPVPSDDRTFFDAFFNHNKA